MSQPFRGQVAMVTGASSGIGRAVAIQLAVSGAQVWLVGRNAAGLEESVRAVPGARSQMHCCRTDLTSDEELWALAKRLRYEAGQLHALVHCAGAISWGPVATAPVGDLDLLYRTNVRAPYLLTQHLLPMLMECRGQVVFMNSSIVETVRGNTGAYGASKCALRALASALRDEVSSQGVRVLSIYPGRTATPMQQQAAVRENREYHPERLIQPDDVASLVIQSLQLPRSAEITDIHVRSSSRS